MSNRLCIIDPEQHGDIRFSPQDFLSCDKVDRGCEAGALDAARGTTTGVSCEDKCTTDVPTKIRHYSLVRRHDIWALRHREIMLRGPVVSAMILYDDLLVYGGGVYRPRRTSRRLIDTERRIMTHGVSIVGWGHEQEADDSEYWIVQTNLGPTWGEGGYARIARYERRMRGHTTWHSTETSGSWSRRTRCQVGASSYATQASPMQRFLKRTSLPPRRHRVTCSKRQQKLLLLCSPQTTSMRKSSRKNSMKKKTKTSFKNNALFLRLFSRTRSRPVRLGRQVGVVLFRDHDAAVLAWCNRHDLGGSHMRCAPCWTQDPGRSRLSVQRTPRRRSVQCYFK